jgi:geranylgeranylglycerol-phosphate geranylgeranyltransferase
MPYFKILRPINFFFVSLTVLFGALYKNPVPFNSNILFAMMSASLISGAGYIINDFFDLKIDVVNRPERMIPSGKISPSAAYIYSVFLFVMGIVLSYLTANIICVSLAIFNSTLLYFYARYFKRKLLWGNLIVSYAAFCSLVYGGLAAGNFENSFYLGLFAFLFTFIREIVKDAEDVEGDREFEVRSIAIAWGKKSVIWLSALITILIILLFIYLQFNHYFTPFTFWLCLLFITIPLLLILRYLYTNIDSKSAFSKSSTILKIDMLILLIIVFIGN